MDDGQDRQVTLHRAGGRKRVFVSGLGHSGPAVAAMLERVAAQGIDVSIGGPSDPFEQKEKPTNTGRRTEKAAAALAKAEAKRQRRAAKRLAQPR